MRFSQMQWSAYTSTERQCGSKVSTSWSDTSGVERSCKNVHAGMAKQMSYQGVTAQDK